MATKKSLELMVERLRGQLNQCVISLTKANKYDDYYDVTAESIRLLGETEIKPSAPKTRKSKIPDDFELSEMMNSNALNFWYKKEREDLDPEEQFEEFLTHHRAHGKTMASWSDAWKTWYTNAVKFNRKPYEVNNSASQQSARQSPYEQRVAAREGSGQNFDNGQY